MGSTLFASSGDSQVIVHWDKGQTHVQSLVTYHWMESIRNLMKDFNFLSFHHIYRDINMEADSLSKKELGPMDGKIMFRYLFLGK